MNDNTSDRSHRPGPVLAATRNGMTFTDCVLVCAEDRDLLLAFDKLRGTNMALCGSPIELAIDAASGRYERDSMLFFEFVYECVWTRQWAGEVGS